MNNRHIFLYGPPGSGKTWIGSRLAQSLNLPFVDLDAAIEDQIEMAIAAFFQQQGESEFRRVELEILKQECAAGTGKVIALGGGALLGQENRLLADQTGEIVCLMAEVDVLLQNIQKDPGKRPLLAGDERLLLQELLQARAVHYQQFPVIKTDGLSTDQILQSIQIQLGRFFVSGMGNGYQVIVRRGLLNQIGEQFQNMGLNGPIAIVTDQHVGRFYLDTVKENLEKNGFQAIGIEIPAGEAYKTINTASLIWDQLVEAGLERGSTVLALGGGVVTDLAGFAAATFLRGLPWVACPTSLLGMVDASLGGKTGLDLKQGKNLVGAFYPPKMVLVDPECLETLPEIELRNGMAEVLKHGIISSPHIVDFCLKSNWMEILPSFIPAIMFAKIQVINEDPYEKGRRAILNLGHTIGHAIELESGFHMRHGEAIGLGMLAESRIALQLGLCPPEIPEIIARAIQNIGLPFALSPSLAVEKILTAMQKDKKKAGGMIKFALPRQIGDVRFGDAVEDSLVRATLLDLQGKSE